MKKVILLLLSLLGVISCKVADKPAALGSIERIDPSLDGLIDSGATLEVLADGYDWSEGPVWIESEKMLLFSDVPTNTIYRWTEERGADVYLKPSGYTTGDSSASPEPGSNGLALAPDGKLVLCQQGDRRLAVLNAPLNEPQPSFTNLADNYGGKRFNSPNDLVVRKNGDLFFTDPPYGMPEGAQEIPFFGVYKISNGVVTLLIDSLTRPNGIGFTPNEKTLIIANSDPQKAVWYAYDLGENDSLVNGRIWYAVSEGDKAKNGLPDGLKIDSRGNVFATGPGGIWIFNKDAKLLGKISIPVATGNCAFSDDGRTLYITADNYLLRLKMKG